MQSERERRRREDTECFATLALSYGVHKYYPARFLCTNTRVSSTLKSKLQR